MTTAKAFAQGQYGAFELKRYYQRNMITGTIISGALPLLIFVILALVGYLTVGEEMMEKLDNPGKIIRQIPPPQNIRRVTPPTTTTIKPEFPKFATNLVPVEDNQVMSVAVIPTIRQKIEIIGMGLDTGAAQGLASGVYTPGEMIGEIIPDPSKIIPYTKEPSLIHAPVPGYPEIARHAGVEGMVWIRIFIDKEGKVRDARVVKSSISTAGFEEAALDAARGRIYSPALQNDQPVGVWITYKVSFKLRK